MRNNIETSYDSQRYMHEMNETLFNNHSLNPQRMKHAFQQSWSEFTNPWRKQQLHAVWNTTMKNSYCDQHLKAIFMCTCWVRLRCIVHGVQIGEESSQELYALFVFWKRGTFPVASKQPKKHFSILVSDINIYVQLVSLVRQKVDTALTFISKRKQPKSKHFICIQHVAPRCCNTIEFGWKREIHAIQHITAK